MVFVWQKRRAAFNHDWLENQYLPALAKWMNLLDGRVEDVQVEHNFVPDVLVQWEGRREEALALPDDFEEQMSPRQLFEEEPLLHCDAETKDWLGDLVHQLWLTRYPVKECISQASEQARETDRAYQQLQEALTKCDNVRSAEALHPFRDEFATFRDQCQGLAEAIEQFSSEIKVV